MKYSILFSIVFFCLLTCTREGGGTTPESDPVTENSANDAATIIDQAIEKQGSDRCDNSLITFDFRDRHYRSKRDNGAFTYERIFTDEDGQKVRDVLTNQGFYREVDGKKVALSAKDSSAYANSVNSVIYFALLPHFLQDPAAQVTYLDETTIKGKPYHEIKVTFKQEGGGKDYEDEFVYWFHRDSLTMDYIAYNYLTDGGGARFREAYDARTISGIRFADYINYKPKEDTRAVATFDSLFETGQLEELSRIVSENIQVSLR